MTAHSPAAGREPLALRSIHLDFHTGPDVPDVGARFDPDAFAETFVRAGVQSVTVFAKCHHGLLYYGTDRAERHPGLSSELDLLDRQVEALHRVGIRAPIYLSVQFDEYAARAHPDWVAVDDEGRNLKVTDGRFVAGWQILDMNSPYQDFLADQLGDVLTHFGTVDGVFLDICMDIPTTSTWAVRAMTDAGLDPTLPEHRDRHARRLARSYMQRYRDIVLPHLAADAPTTVWFNSRPKTALGDERDLVDHVEIEALPTGGWGYSYLPYVARYVQPLGLPATAHTARFHKSWGDNAGLKNQAALDYECAQLQSLDIAVCVGDVLHPSGVLSSSAYELITTSFDRHRAREPHLVGGARQTEIAVVMPVELGDAPGAVGVGIVRGLQQLRQQFDVVSRESDLSPYRVVIVPEVVSVDAGFADRLRAYHAGGGSLLVSGDALVGPDGRAILSELGVSVDGRSPFSHTFIRDSADPNRPAAVDYEGGLRLHAGESAVAAFTVVEPYFERAWDHFCGHDYTPPGRETDYAALVLGERTAVTSSPLFTAYGRHAAIVYRTMLTRALDHLLPDPLIRVGGPLHIETSVVDTADTRLVHLTSYLASREAEGVSPLTQQLEGIDLVRDPFPLVDVPVRIRVPNAPTAVTLEPGGRELAFDYAGGYVSTAVTVLDGNALVVAHGVSSRQETPGSGAP